MAIDYSAMCWWSKMEKRDVVSVRGVRVWCCFVSDFVGWWDGVGCGDLII